ncbi:ABC transporter ATP-binding protein [Aquabacterium humicola]|uniref:ABC transporter ATP-binding protein n=1 Tax=Aquabacterium humicola TaxID=3237377 RepID=UPI002542A434|nr:ABC transporter ATP-binding protein [Rubrivivax pictus]
MNPLLTVRGLGKRFGGLQVLDGVGFDAEAGRVFSIIGPNGAGKTTLLNLLAGVYRPDEGHITLGGQVLNGPSPHRHAAAGLGRTFQNLQVFFNMSALDNVMTGRHLHEPQGMAAAMWRAPSVRRAETASRARAVALLQQLGLDAWLDAPADAMPYGALKRLEIARALAAEPRLLLLDEPAAGLNATEAQEIGALVRRLAADGMAVLLVEHNMRLVMSASDRVLVLDHGRKLAEGTPQQVAGDARVIEAYLGAQPAAEAEEPSHA